MLFVAGMKPEPARSALVHKYGEVRGFILLRRIGEYIARFVHFETARSFVVFQMWGHIILMCHNGWIFLKSGLKQAKKITLREKKNFSHPAHDNRRGRWAMRIILFGIVRG